MASEHDADAVVDRIATYDGRLVGEVESILSCLKPGDRLPGGLVVVPEDATTEMQIAALEAFLHEQPPMAPVHEGQELSDHEAAQRYMDLGARIRNGREMAAIYRAMLAASGDT